MYAGEIGKRSEEYLGATEQELKRTLNLLNAIIETSVDAIFVKDAHGRYRLINPAGANALGRTPSEVIGKTDAELAPFEFSSAVSEADKIVLTTGQSISNEATLPSAKGQRTFSSMKAPWRDANGNVIGVIGISRDISERKRAEAAAFFLAEASQVLSTSLDYETTLSSLAWLVVPELADYCFIDIIENGRNRRLVVAHDDPSKAEIIEKITHRFPQDGREVAWGSNYILRTGQSQLITEVTDSHLRQLSTCDEHYKMLLSLGEKSFMGVPLRAGGRIVGAMVFLAADSGRIFTSEDLSLAEELARRSAIAVDNSWLYRQAQQAKNEKAELIKQLADQRGKVEDIFSRIPAVAWEIWSAPGAGSSFMSPYVHQLLGVTQDEIADMTMDRFFSFIHPDDRSRAIGDDQNICRSASPGISVFRMIARNGSVIPVKTMISPILDVDGTLIGRRGVILEAVGRQPVAARGSRISIDPISFTVSKDGIKSAALTSREFQIALLIDGAPEYRISRSDLVTGIWGKLKVSTNSLDVHLFNLRKKLAPLGLEISFSPPNFYTLVLK